MNFLVHDKEVLNKYNKIWDKTYLKIYLKKNLIVNQCVMINALKLK